MVQFRKQDRDRVVAEMEARVGQSLDRVESYDTLYEDDDGRAYLIVGQVGTSYTLRKGLLEKLKDCPRGGLLVFARKSEDGSVTVYAQNIVPLLDRIDWEEDPDAFSLTLTEGSESLVWEEGRDYRLQKLFSIPEGAESPGVVREPDGSFVTVEDLLPDAMTPFTRHTFRVLDMLEVASPAGPADVNEFESVRKEALKRGVVGPLEDLFDRAARHLPEQVRTRLVADKDQAWTVRERRAGRPDDAARSVMAFHPPDEIARESPQLFVALTPAGVQYGFQIGPYAIEARERLQSRVRRHKTVLRHLLKDHLEGQDLLLGGEDVFVNEPNSEEEDDNLFTETQWSSWIDSPQNQLYLRIVQKHRPGSLRSLSTEDLARRVAQTWKRVYPLVILATEEEPITALGRYLEEPESEEERLRPEKPLAEVSAETGFEESDLRAWVEALRRKNQAVFYGPPGTGKTFVAQRLAEHVVGGGRGEVDLVQFHPSYAYEDFMQGLRPVRGEDGALSYDLEPGRFLEFCRRAEATGDPCVLIVDEINRANLSRVFGELMYLLEYRDEAVDLAGGTSFRIPENVFVIGTMNTADRSIALVDHALRRRFAFLPLYPDWGVLRHYHDRRDTGVDVDPLVELVEDVNEQIDDPNYAVGPTYFMQEDLDETIKAIWKYEIVPYLEEHFYDAPREIDEFRWEAVQGRLG
jgi:5-methylcytosine-specific restriction protein B